MFDLSFAELALVAVVAALFIGPKELPVVVRTVGKFFMQIKKLTAELRGMFDDLSTESGLKDTAHQFESEMRMIRGDDGKLYESYAPLIQPDAQENADEQMRPLVNTEANTNPDITQDEPENDR